MAESTTNTNSKFESIREWVVEHKLRTVGEVLDISNDQFFWFNFVTILSIRKFFTNRTGFANEVLGLNFYTRMLLLIWISADDLNL